MLRLTQEAVCGTPMSLCPCQMYFIKLYDQQRNPNIPHHERLGTSEHLTVQTVQAT